MVRRVLALVAVSAAAVALFFTATSAPSPPSPDAPESLSRPFVQRAGVAADDVQVTSQFGLWRKSARGPLHFQYSWVECDLAGKHCSPVPRLQAKTIAPPQEPQIVTLRGVVTATNQAGSTSVTTGNFYYDMAGLAFDALDRGFVRNHLQYDPDQLRAWYGLSSEQNGAGQTISDPGLRPRARASSRGGPLQLPLRPAEDLSDVAEPALLPARDLVCRKTPDPPRARRPGGSLGRRRVGARDRSRGDRSPSSSSASSRPCSPASAGSQRKTDRVSSPTVGATPAIVGPTGSYATSFIRSWPGLAMCPTSCASRLRVTTARPGTRPRTARTSSRSGGPSLSRDRTGRPRRKFRGGLRAPATRTSTWAGLHGRRASTAAAVTREATSPARRGPCLT